MANPTIRRVNQFMPDVPLDFIRRVFNVMPIQPKFLGDVLDRRHPTPPSHVVSKTLGVKRIVCQKHQSLALHFATASTQNPAHLELQGHSRIPTGRISNLADSTVVPTALHFSATAAHRFFDRLTSAMTRPLESPNTPCTLDNGRNPSKAYVSHNRLAGLMAFGMKLPCLFFPDSQTTWSWFSCSV
jgi:hypothetical protein